MSPSVGQLTVYASAFAIAVIRVQATQLRHVLNFLIGILFDFYCSRRFTRQNIGRAGSNIDIARTDVSAYLLPSMLWYCVSYRTALDNYANRTERIKRKTVNQLSKILFQPSAQSKVQKSSHSIFPIRNGVPGTESGGAIVLFNKPVAPDGYLAYAMLFHNLGSIDFEPHCEITSNTEVHFRQNACGEFWCSVTLLSFTLNLREIMKPIGEAAGFHESTVC